MRLVSLQPGPRWMLQLTLLLLMLVRHIFQCPSKYQNCQFLSTKTLPLTINLSVIPRSTGSKDRQQFARNASNAKRSRNARSLSKDMHHARVGSVIARVVWMLVISETKEVLP